MYYFVYLENIHWRRWIFYVKLFCAHTTIHIFTSLHILLRAVSFLSDSYKSARVIINSGQDSHAFIHNKMILSHDSSFSHCQSFIYIQHVCVFNVTKCDTNFFCLSNCVECICERSKCDAFCLSTFVVASFSTRLLLTVESCYRPIGDEKCVQKLTDKNREFENLRMTTILYYTTANTTVCIVFTLFISFTSDAVKIVYTFRDYVYHSICIGHVYKKLCA